MRPILLLAAGAALTGATATDHASQGATRAPAACRSALSQGVLPVWARAGFSDPRPRMPHVLGRSGRIAAIEFGYPLLSPPSKVRANKVLWVSRSPWQGVTSLWIRAQRMQGTRAVGQPVTRRIQGGPGPSYVNLPAAGCWRLALHWAGREDTLDLHYSPGPG
jgi:hypothetical protein